MTFRLSRAASVGVAAASGMVALVVLSATGADVDRAKAAAEVSRSAEMAFVRRSSSTSQAENTESTAAFTVFSTKTGERDTRFPPMIRDESHSPEVVAVVADGSGGWFVGGQFDKKDGVTCRNFAHFRNDARLDPRDCLAPNGRVTALLRYRGVLYVGGSFTRIGGRHRSYVAAINLRSGRVQRWDAHMTAKTYYDRDLAIPRGIWALAARGAILYIAGQFDSIGGLPRKSVAALRLADGRPTSFRAPEPVLDGYSPDVLLATATSVIINGGIDPTGKLVALDLGTGRRQKWTLRGPVQAGDVISYHNTFVVAHTFQSFDKSPVVQYQAASGQRLRSIASSDGVIATLHLDGSRLYVGGSYARVNGTKRASLAALQLPSTRPLIWNPTGARPGFGVTLAIASTRTSVAVGVGTCRPNC